jgi:phosphoribosylformylglycinamidine (FGAM) synthase-like amidotransferase family enzyme
LRAGGGIVEEAEGGGASQIVTDFSAVADMRTRCVCGVCEGSQLTTVYTVLRGLATGQWCKFANAFVLKNH